MNVPPTVLFESFATLRVCVAEQPHQEHQRRGLTEFDEGDRCINCDTLELRNATAHRPWRRLAVVSIHGGALETLQKWPLCPNCETSQGVTLLQFVRLKLT